MNSQELCAVAKISYRQLDAWTNRGWVQPLPRAKAKSGVPRSYPPEAVGVAIAMGRLTEVGLRPRCAYLVVTGHPRTVATIQAALDELEGP